MPQVQVPCDCRWVECTALKAEGNTLHKKGSVLEAVAAYTKAIEKSTAAICHSILMVQLLGNRGLCNLALEQWSQAGL